jgi:hypothetical protein
MRATAETDAETAAPPDGEAPTARGEQPAPELIAHLEPAQLVSETFRALPRARLSARVTVGLWALRIFAVAVSAMVVYTFIERLS